MNIKLLSYSTYENLASRVLNLEKHCFLEPASSLTPTSTGFYGIGIYGAAFPSNGFYSTGIHSPTFRDAAFRCAS